VTEIGKTHNEFFDTVRRRNNWDQTPGSFVGPP